MVELESPRLSAIFHALGDPTRREIRWRTHVCRLNPEALAAAHDWLDSYRRFWTDRLDILEDLLSQEEKTPKPEGDAP